MNVYSISELARLFDLSRSTLLYYDKIGLLKAPSRTFAGYRQYTEAEYEKLARICMFRSVDLSLADIKELLSKEQRPSISILEKRLKEMDEQISYIRGQQQLILKMLKEISNKKYASELNKEMWISILRAAGMDETALMNWHKEFELRAPEAHFNFLLSLGISKKEVKEIQEWAANISK